MFALRMWRVVNDLFWSTWTVRSLRPGLTWESADIHAQLRDAAWQWTNVWRLKVMCGSRFGPVPCLHYRQLQRSLIRIPAGQRCHTSSSPAKGAHLSGKRRDHRLMKLPRLPDCRALCLHIKDKRTELQRESAEQPFYLVTVRCLNPPSTERAL